MARFGALTSQRNFSMCSLGLEEEELVFGSATMAGSPPVSMVRIPASSAFSEALAEELHTESQDGDPNESYPPCCCDGVPCEGGGESDCGCARCCAHCSAASECDSQDAQSRRGSMDSFFRSHMNHHHHHHHHHHPRSKSEGNKSIRKSKSCNGNGHVHWADEKNKELARSHPRKRYNRNPTKPQQVKPILKDSLHWDT